MGTFSETLARVHEAARRGLSVDEIDEEIITQSGLDDGAQAALWIVAGHDVEAAREEQAGRERYAARQALAFAAVTQPAASGD